MILQAKNLKKNFMQGGLTIEVLAGVNLELSQGETVAIVGQSGSGKSTLLSLFSGIDRPSEGEIIIAGQSLVPLSESAITRFRSEHIGIVFQQFHLMSNLTALENVSLALEIKGAENAQSKAKDFLNRVGLSHREKHFPSQLSGGECQRVAIARALACAPAILLADEPSGSLDAQTGEQVINLLFDLVKKNQTTLLLVTHSERVASLCQKRLILQNGTLCAL